MDDERCESVHEPTGERCLRGPHDGRHVGHGPVEWTDGVGAGNRGKKERKHGDGPVYLEFQYGTGGAPLSYFWGPGREKQGLAGKSAHFGIDKHGIR